MQVMQIGIVWGDGCAEGACCTSWVKQHGSCCTVKKIKTLNNLSYLII